MSGTANRDASHSALARRRAWAVRILGAALVCLVGLSAQGCSLFHHGEPQPQQFMDGLYRANGAQASQLWLEMRVPDRSELSPNIGLRNEVSQADIGRALPTQQSEQAVKNGDDRGTASDDGDGEPRQTEIPGCAGDPSAGSLSNLPALNAMQPSQPATRLPAQ